MVSLETVEKLAYDTSPQAIHAASTQADPQRGENIILFTTDAALSREQLINSAKASGLPELAVARKIVLIEEIPLLGTGKTDYVTLKRMAESLQV
jgi:acyl-[acyl-carrier-protein]-phospholipid O-acyltransferase/long-chain-fatty-acid--[acyl-carrier-protein] ligase